MYNMRQFDMKRLVFYFTALLLPVAAHAAEKPQPIPIGYDAYRNWGQWAEQRIGMRAYMGSTYDRRGGNEGADASHFLYQLSNTFNVSLDLEGPGLFVFSRFNHWHGSPWHFVVDGVDHVVQETSTRDPLNPAPHSIFLPPYPFPTPLNWTWAATKGADLIWTPIPFKDSFRIAYTRTHYGTGYYIYDKFVPGTPLSHPLDTWQEGPPPQDVLELISRSGTDIAPIKGCKKASGTVDLPAHGVVDVARLTGKAAIRALKFSIPRQEALQFEHVRLRITWDDRKQPSVEAPIALFYGAGTLYNRDNQKYLVKAFPVNIRFSKDRVVLSCYFPMPFFRSARVQLVGADDAISGIDWQLRYMRLHKPANLLSYFHATYRDIPEPVAGKDLVLLDTRNVEGGGNWSGQFVGTSFIFSHEANLTTLEGDPRFFFDDSQTPQAQGTGTEEWAGGGDYWGGANMSLPFAGHPVGARSAQSAVNDEDKIESAYRFLLADAMPFGKNAVIRLEHGGTDQSTQHYETVAYWYGLPAASLVKTDELQVGNAASEKEHGYDSPQASAPYAITSRYEWGVDTLDGKVIYPEQTAYGRTTKGTSEFHLRLRPDNLGVLLRRTLDYSFPNQRAEVYVAGPSRSGWKSAGIWYLAGSNTSVYSNPKQELGETEHIVETSNRRFRDDAFLISRNLTQGRKEIWVRIKFTPVNRPLYPGYPLHEQAWSAIQYTAYCFIQPQFQLSR
jgi:hypothetical protein